MVESLWPFPVPADYSPATPRTWTQSSLATVRECTGNALKNLAADGLPPAINMGGVHRTRGLAAETFGHSASNCERRKSTCDGDEISLQRLGGGGR